RVGEGGDAGDGAEGHVLLAAGRRVGAGQGGQLLVGDRDALVGRGDGGQGVVLEGDGDGVGAFLSVSVAGSIDAVVATAQGDDRADRGGRVAPVDGRRKVARCRLGPDPGRVGERRDAGDGPDAGAF